MKIGLSGKQRSGKDTVADYLVKKYNLKKIGFADELKKLAKEYFGFTDEELEKKQWNVREALQLLGNVGRLKNENFWVNKTLSNIDDNIVIKDVRYKNEADILKQNGFILVRIESDRDIREKRGQLYNEDDLSETDLDNYDFDFIIYNNGKKSMLYKQIDWVLSKCQNQDMIN